MTTHTRLIGVVGITAGALIVVAPEVDGTAGTVGWIAGILLLLPFLSGVAAVLTSDVGSSRWLGAVVSTGAAIAIALYLVSLGVANVANSVAKDSPVHEPLHAVEATLFGMALLPLGLALAAAAVAIVRHRRLPRWFGYATGVVAIALLANGGELGAEEMPAMMLFLLWTFVVAIILVVRRRRTAIEVPAPEVAVPVRVG